MKNTILYESACSIYPGEYTPLLNEEEVLTELNQLQSNNVILPRVNISDESDIFKIELAIPGVKREDFLVYANENVLSVSAIHKVAEPATLNERKMHEFDNQYFDRHVILPSNVDPEFSIAEYISGILYIFISKSNALVNTLRTRIPVY
jgi:HSP20 family protein